MATYFHGNNSEIQENGGDGLQTLILMNPGYVGYSEAQHQPPVSGSSSSNLVFPNSNYPPSQTSQQYYFGGGATSASPQDSHFYNPYNGAAREATHAKKGLSLRLSSQQPTGYGEMQSQLPGVEDLRVSNDMQSGVLSCKYLKAAQELLDEVVNVGKGERDNRQSKNINGESFGANGDGENGGEKIAKRGAELTTAEKQEIQMKKAKLVNMLDEVEQRYKQYHQQMQIVISWFEQVAGIGSAKTYTALALQTISKQFRCLKHAILSQIKIASKSLGEVDNWEGKIEGLRIKYVDNQIRQQGALQHLGMIQHNAWRPQRGLPERSVSVLRAWLFEHFLHPYPKDSDKIMLAKQTGLSRSQVSNWFINARVRLWKPMVEEMYTEEIKENEGNGSEDKHSKTEQNQVSTSQATAPQAKGSESEYENKSFISEQEDTMRNNAGFNLIGSSEMESIIQGSPKKPRITDMLQSPSNIPSMNMESSPSNVDNEHASMKFGDERQGRDGFTLMEAPTNFIGGFGSYPMVELGRFGSEQFQAPYSRNGVSLSLGLHQNFLPNQNIQLGRGAEIGEADEFNGMNAPTSTQSNSSYENINIQNRKSFASQLFPDFVT